jgi:hypothetical protein
VGETNRKGDNDPKKRASEIIAKLDATGDKKLSRSEFVTGYVCIMTANDIYGLCHFLFLDAKTIQLYINYLLLMFKH